MDQISAFPLSQPLTEVLEELGYTSLTPIQAQSIPPLLAGKDLIGQSETGSGKTAAFSLPILEKLRLSLRRPQALILCPTRELSSQVAREIRKLGRRLAGLQVITLSGGQLLGPQIGSLEQGVHIVVGTPGRVCDHIRRGTLVLKQANVIVLDEADRMLDMGFEDDIKAIFAALPPKRQTVFFSATFPDAVETLSKTYQQNAQRITVAARERSKKNIRQILFQTKHDARLLTLQRVLAAHPSESTIIFANQRAIVSEITETLRKAGASADCIHGELEQDERDRVMARLRNGSIRILVATDVAARGIDVSDLGLVVNYELPFKPDTYLHRIGRTGRAGKKGLAISLVTARDQHRIEAIEEAAGYSLEQGKLEEGRGRAPGAAAYQDATMQTLTIGGGRKEKLRPGDILGAFTGEAGGFSAEDIGKIEIHDHFTYVAVSREIAKSAVQRLREGRIKARKFSVDLLP